MTKPCAIIVRTIMANKNNRHYSMEKELINILRAEKSQSTEIAELIMEAMNYECCQNWAGPEHSLDDFRHLMQRLVAMDESQYSYRNALVATDADSSVAGICVCYDGGELHRLRRAFIDGARESFGIDYSGIDDETTEGEYYIDSLAVSAPWRGHGIAHRLLSEAIEEGRRRGLARVGLLVDLGNPRAERLYESVGFRFANYSAWGGHDMKHLTIEF